MAHISEAIRRRARRKRMSIEVLADFAGVSRSGLWAIVHCERLPSVRFLLKIANALDCKVSQLVP